MPPGLLDSQFKTLEPPGFDENAIDVSIDATVDAIVDDIVGKLQATGRNSVDRKQS
jgi:gluconokinase